MNLNAIPGRPTGPTPGRPNEKLRRSRTHEQTLIHIVITRLVPVILISKALRHSSRDGRDKPGHDNKGYLIVRPDPQACARALE
jgi:hypothetical protein